jgi:hypothetical protein
MLLVFVTGALYDRSSEYADRQIRSSYGWRWRSSSLVGLWHSPIIASLRKPMGDIGRECPRPHSPGSREIIPIPTLGRRELRDIGQDVVSDTHGSEMCFRTADLDRFDLPEIDVVYVALGLDNHGM